MCVGARCKLWITEGMETKEVQYGGAAATRLSHLESEKSGFFHNHKIPVQDHGVVALIHTSSTSLRTMKTESV
jgi:hypothetical protein